MSDRAELQAKLDKAKVDYLKAGVIHRRDLSKYIRRLSKELQDYDRFQAYPRV